MRFGKCEQNLRHLLDSAAEVDAVGDATDGEPRDVATASDVVKVGFYAWLSMHTYDFVFCRS